MDIEKLYEIIKILEEQINDLNLRLQILEDENQYIKKVYFNIIEN
jgi:hypothetical protein